MPSSDPHDLTIEIKFDGQTSIAGDKGNVDLKNGQMIQRFHVDQKLGVPDYFQVQLNMTVFKDIVLLDKVKPGMAVEMKVGYGTEETIFKGEVSYIEPHFAAGEMFVTVSGYDNSHRLTRGTMSRAFGDGHKVNQGYGDVAGTLISDSKAGKGGASDGLGVSRAGKSDSKSAYIAYYNTSLYEAIRNTVGNFGMDWNSASHLDAKKVGLKTLEKGSKKLAICRDKFDPAKEAQALSADFQLSTVKQVSKVIVRSWDMAKKKAIKGEAEKASLIIGGAAGYEQAGKAHFGSSSSGRVVEVTDLPVASVAEAKEVAESILGRLSMDWMTATVVIEGRPELHAGLIVELKEFGTRYSGEYLIEGCTHVFIASSGQTYKTYLSLVRNGSPEP